MTGRGARDSEFPDSLTTSSLCLHLFSIRVDVDGHLASILPTSSVGMAIILLQKGQAHRKTGKIESSHVQTLVMRKQHSSQMRFEQHANLRPLFSHAITSHCFVLALARDRAAAFLDRAVMLYSASARRTFYERATPI